tara:strand:- start:19163 stop:19450 length:288 start_codon:yes stop_codon:yes gene_type:complete
MCRAIFDTVKKVFGGSKRSTTVTKSATKTPPPKVVPPASADAAKDVKKTVDDFTVAEKMKKGFKSTILTGSEGVSMETILKRRLTGGSSEKAGRY